MVNGRTVVLVLLSAALQGFALPPWSITPLAWVALVPLFIALRGCGARSAAVLGLLWGTAAIWAIGYWVPIALAFYYQQPAWFGTAFAFAVSVTFGAAYAGFGVCARARPFRHGGAAGALLLGALWVGWEFARAHLLTGDPWLLFGYALAATPVLAQAADFGSVYVLSFVVVAVNAAVAEMLATWDAAPWRRFVSTGAVAVLLPLALYAYGARRMSLAVPDAPRIPLRVVQGNNDIGTQWREEFYGRGLADYLRLSRADWPRRADASALLVWPESALTFFLAEEPTYRAGIAAALGPIGADLIVGAPHFERDGSTTRYFNSAFHFAADGTLDGRYDKRHLLPFAEYFPLRTIGLLRRNFERVRYFTPGETPAVLRTQVGDVATVICFEGIFPDLVRKAMADSAILLVNISNDAWLGRRAGPEQHLSMVALRAIENRTWVVRATTTGISAIIDPFGRIVSRSSTFAPAVLDGEIVPLRVPTPYKRFGDVFAYACIVACVVAALVRSRTVDRRSF